VTEIEIAAKAKAISKAIGKDTDANVAEKFGVSRQYIFALRKKHGIPAFTVPEALSYPLPVWLGERDVIDTKRAMKKAGYKSRSKYMREAVREKNTEVLGK
jgi:hypothetical protein